MRTPAAALLVVAGAILGAGLATLLRPSGTPAPPAPPSLPSPGVVATQEVKAGLHEPPSAATPRPEGAAPLDELAVRADEWAFLREALVRERERREGNRMDPALGGLEVLRRVKESGVDPLSVLESYDAVRARVRVVGKSVAIEAPADGKPVNLAEAAKDAAIIEFGPGTFVIDGRSREVLSIREGTRSLEIHGAGMDRTVLTGDVDRLFFSHEVAAYDNLLVRDLTVDAGKSGGMLLDVRGRASVALDNVRVDGWRGGGHSAPIGVSGSALFGARGCEFLCGEGGGLFVLSVRGLSLAVFEKCLFSDVRDGVVGPGGSGEAGSAVRLIDCTYRNCAAVSRRMERGKGKTAFPVAVRGGEVALGPADLSDDERRTFWGSPYLASVEGVMFGVGKPACTLGEILAVLDQVSVGPTETVFGARFLAPAGEGPARFGIRILERSASKVRWRVVGPNGADLEKDPRNPGGGWNAPTASPLEKTGLAAVVRNSEIPVTTAAYEVALVPSNSENPEILAVYLEPGTVGWPTWVADSVTGKIISGPRAR